MKSTGIIRRIDDLGRISIPKEIRRTRHVHDGDPLEFFMEDSKTLSLRKYCPMGGVILEEVKFLIPAFKAAFGADIFVVDDVGHVIYSTERALNGKRLDSPIPVDASTLTAVSFDEVEVAVSGCCRIVTDKTTFTGRYEGAVLVIGNAESDQHIAQTIAYAIGKKIEEHF